MLNWKKSRNCHCCLDAHSAFKLWGSSTIKNLYSARNSWFTFSNVSKESILSDDFIADVQSTLKINIKEQGFLTIGTDFRGTPVWNRRWCILDGSSLNYWNYPNEDNVAPPIGVLDLTKCTIDQIKIVDRDICARPRTLLLELKSDRAKKRYLLSADSMSDLEEWQKQLNLVLSALKKWNDIDE